MDGKKQALLFDLPQLSLGDLVALTESEKKNTYVVLTSSKGDFRVSLYDLQQFLFIIGNRSLSVEQGLGVVVTRKID